MKARRELVTLMLEEADEHEVNLNLESFNGSVLICGDATLIACNGEPNEFDDDDDVVLVSSD